MAKAACIICKRTMEFEVASNGVATGGTGLDPCALLLVTNAFGPRESQREQEFPCHIECFRRLVGDDSLLYILAPDYPTVGDYERDQVGDGTAETDAKTLSGESGH